MDQPSTSETSPLVKGFSGPSYVFTSTTARLRQNRLRKIQCCICSVILGIFALAIIISVSYNIENPDDIPDNSTTDNLNDGSQVLPVLLTLSWPRSDTVVGNWSGASPLEADLKAAGAAGASALTARRKFEETSPRGRLGPSSPAARAQLALNSAPRTARLGAAGYAKDHATRHFVQNKTYEPNWCIGRGPFINASWTLEECLSPPRLRCGPSRYRSVTGACNNLQHPSDWGTSFMPFRRALPPAYADGVSSPRVALDGQPLPSAREVSVKVHRPVYRADPDFTVLLAVWGQFLDHDITATALNQGVNGTPISCCEDYNTPGMLMHPECFPVAVGPQDPFYYSYNTTCMNFVRSMPAPSCFLGPRDQLNQATVFIDGSTIYGSYEELVKTLRSFSGGELVMLITPDGRELLPASKDPNDGCNEKALNDEGKYCFVSGDLRANENLHLTTMHVLWARQHNRLARRLHVLNPHWDDETLFQEARRIVGAQMQHITYNEFLSVLMGDDMMNKLELSPKKEGYYHGYNASLDPNIANHFASSAFRFAHTLLPTLFKIARNNADTPEYVHLHKMLFNPYSLYNQDGVDLAMSGAMQTDMQKVDAYFTPELTNHLFEKGDPEENLTTASSTPTPAPHPHSVGLDLVSLNIQRGRDHGIASYPAWRQHCGFPRPKSFEDLRGTMDNDSLERISSIYKTVDDVDLYTASLSEVPLQGRVLGATVTCLLLDQFLRIKRADRYWYETPEKPQAFTLDQLSEIRNTTLASIICKNGDSLKLAQRHVMRSAGPDNPLERCSALPDVDLRHWAERPDRKLAGRTPARTDDRPDDPANATVDDISSADGATALSPASGMFIMTLIIFLLDALMTLS